LSEKCLKENALPDSVLANIAVFGTRKIIMCINPNGNVIFPCCDRTLIQKFFLFAVNVEIQGCIQADFAVTVHVVGAHSFLSAHMWHHKFNPAAG
jgi:hypothetical protein